MLARSKDLQCFIEALKAGRDNFFPQQCQALGARLGRTLGTLRYNCHANPPPHQGHSPEPQKGMFQTLSLGSAQEHLHPIVSKCLPQEKVINNEMSSLPLKKKLLDRRDRTVGRVFALRRADPGWILNTLYGSQYHQQ